MQSAETVIDGRRVIVVDTPGFSDTHLTDTEVLTLIAEWLKYTYDEDTRLSGLIFLHRISDQRMEHSSVKNLDMFGKLCGEENMGNVVLATTMWENADEADGLAREQQLRDEFWADMIDKGSKVKRVRNSEHSALKLARSFLGYDTIIVRLQHELASGLQLSETGIGAAISSEINKIREDFMEKLEEMQRSSHLRVDEIEQLRDQITRLDEERRKLREQAIAQVAKCSRSWWQRSWRCLELCGTKTRRSGIWTCPTCQRDQNNVSY